MSPKQVSKYLKLALVATLVAACDPFTEDSIPGYQQTTFGQTTFFVQPGKSTFIDLRSIASQSLEAVAISISTSTKKGRLSRMDSLTLRYDPASSFEEGTDRFECIVRKSGMVVMSQSITLKIAKGPDEIPCEQPAVYVVEDFVSTMQDSSVVVPFLANDRICVLDSASLETSIRSQPRNGKAILDGAFINYTPASGFAGRDSLVYRIITKKGELPGAYYGMIRVLVVCEFELRDSYTIDLTDGVEEVRVTTACGTGYQFPIGIGTCPVYDLQIRPLADLENGFCFTKDGSFLFLPDTYSWITRHNTARFNICLNGQCKDVSLTAVVFDCGFMLQDSYTLDLTDAVEEELITTGCGTGYAFPIYAGLENCPPLPDSMQPFLQSTGNFCYDETGQILFLPQRPYVEVPTARIHICIGPLCKDVELIVKQPEIACAPDELWKSISFLDESHAMAWCRNGIYESFDAGVNWTKIAGLPAIVREPDLLSGYFYDERTFVLYGACVWAGNDYDCSKSFVATTTDRGATWNTPSVSLPVTSVFFTSAASGCLATSSYAGDVSSDRIYRTTDGGRTWNETLFTNWGGPFTSMDFVGPVGFMAGFGSIYKTINYGASWTLAFSYPSETFHRAIPAMVMIDGNTVCASFWTWGIAISSDGGKTFTSVINDPSITGLSFSPSGGLGIAISSDGTAIYKTVDKGLHWTAVAGYSTVIIRKVLVPSDKVVYIWTEAGEVIKYNNP